MAKRTLVALILWPISGVLLVPPLLLIGVGYGYDLGEYLSLLWFPNEPDENGWWLFRIVLFVTFVASTLVLAVAAFRKIRGEAISSSR